MNSKNWVSQTSEIFHKLWTTNMQIKLIFEIFFKIWFKVPWVLFQDFLLEGVRFTLNNDLHCLGKGIKNYGFFKTNNFLKNQKFVAL